MKKHFYITLFFISIISYPLIAQETKKSANGFGIEAGVGYNYLKLNYKVANSNDTSALFNNMWVQPCFRIHYDIKIKQLGVKNILKLKSFIGYYTFGGKHLPDVNSNRIILAFSSIEIGAGLSFDFSNRFQISPLLKAQYIVSAKERHLLSSQLGVPANDIKPDIRDIAANVGLQFRYMYHHFTIGAEAWYGLTNFYKTSGTSAKEINYRVMLGFEI
jgi:hypothetical protein